jgi:hypothetical protein
LVSYRKTVGVGVVANNAATGATHDYIASTPLVSAKEPFTKHGLRVTDGTYTWNSGDPATGNLGGTVSTLSGVDGSVNLNCTGDTAPGTRAGGGHGAEAMLCTLGVASIDGWAILNNTFDAVVGT